MRNLLILTLLLAAVSAWPLFHCPVDFEWTDIRSSPNSPITFTGAAASCLPNLGYVNPSVFDVISFNSFHGTTGDVEGRLFCKGPFVVGNGFTVGWGACSGGTFPYSLVVDGNATFGSGSIAPDGSNFYVGQYFNGPTYLNNFKVPNCGIEKNAWATFATYAYNEYKLLTNDLKGQSNTVGWNVAYNSLHLTSVTGSGAGYQPTFFLTIQASQFNQLNAYSFDVKSSYKSASILCINVIGTSVTFNGGGFPAGVFNHVIYNLPTATSVTVNTAVFGSILAPFATYYQTGGTVYGKVIVSDIQSVVQINRAHCPSTTSNFSPNQC